MINTNYDKFKGLKEKVRIYNMNEQFVSDVPHSDLIIYS